MCQVPHSTRSSTENLNVYQTALPRVIERNIAARNLCLQIVVSHRKVKGMTIIRSILLAALIFWSTPGWSQVFTAPQPGMLQGIRMQPEMQRGLVSPGLTVSPQNRGFNNPGEPGGPGYDSNENLGSTSDAAYGTDPGAFNDPRLQYGPATEGYPTRGVPNEPRRDSSGNQGKTFARSARKPLSLTVARHSATANGGYFGILGAVDKPAVYFQKSDRMLLVDLVQLAGGTTEEASGSVRIVRQGRSGLQTFLSETSRFEVLHGDVVYIEVQRLAAQAGLQQFSQPLRRTNGPSSSSTDNLKPGTPITDPSRKVPNPAQAYLAFVGLAPRPIIVPVPANEATLSAAMMWLKQNPDSTPLPRVLSPIPVPQSGNGQPTEELLLPSGTVLVFDPATVNRAVLPDFPPVVGELTATSATNAGPDTSAQDSNSAIRVRGPLPGQFRTERPEYRTNSLKSRAIELPPQEPQSPPAELRPQRPQAKSAVVEHPAVDSVVTHPGEARFERTPPKSIIQSPHHGGPMLFSPGNHGSNQPHAHAPEELPRSDKPLRPDQRVTPADNNQIRSGNATPAGFENEPAVIPEGPQLGQPARNLGALVEPRRLDDVERLDAPVQDANAAESAISAAELALNRIPVPSPAPWYASTIGMVWLSSSVIILVFVGLWISSRYDWRLSRQPQTEPLDDLMHNRLPVTTESVRPPLGLRFHGRPPASQTAVPAPHLSQTDFPQHPVTSKSELNQPAPPKKPLGPTTGLEAALVRPARTISDQERNLRAEYHQAWLDRDRNQQPNSRVPETPVLDSEQTAAPAPHFIPRPKILANVPRVNLAPGGSANHGPTTDDSTALGRALANRRPNK